MMKRNQFRLFALCVMLVGCVILLLSDMIISPSKTNHDFWLGFVQGFGTTGAVLGFILLLISLFKKETNK